jgi:hypothetical protein
MWRSRFVRHIGVAVSLLTFVVIGGAGCLAVPVPVPGPVVVAPGPPVVVGPGHRHGYGYGYYRRSYGGYHHGGWR